MFCCVTYWVVELTPYPYNSFQMTLHIIVLIAGVPIGVATYDDPQFWPIDTTNGSMFALIDRSV